MKNMKNIKSFDQINENGPNDTPIEIMRNMKTIKNWNYFDNLNSPRERNINIAGKYIETTEVRGYINRIEGVNVYVESIDNEGVVKINIKDAVKYLTEKTKEPKEIKGTPIEGPANITKGASTKTASKSTGFAPDINAKSTVAKDNIIAKKNNKVKMDSLGNLSKPFDSKITKGSKKSISTKIDKKGSEAKDTKTIANKIYKESPVKKFTEFEGPK